MNKSRSRRAGISKIRIQAKLRTRSGFKFKVRRSSSAAIDRGRQVSEMPIDGKFGNPRVRAIAAGAQPGDRLPINQARAVLDRIAAEAADLFGDQDQARAYLNAKNFAGSGKNALDLVRIGGAATVIGRLDELRFGSQG